MSDLLTGLWVRVSTLAERDEGQALTEYALLITIVAGLVTAAAFTGIGGVIVSKITTAINGI